MMASYKIVVKKSVEKDLRSLPKSAIKRVMSQLENLRDEPRPRQSKKLTGAERLYRVRVGDYRIIYEIDEEGEEVMIIYIRHRREAYRDI